MVMCSQCLNNLNNTNLHLLKESLKLMVEVQELDPATLETLQDRVCRTCTGIAEE